VDLTGKLVRLRALRDSDARFIADYLAIPDVAQNLASWAQLPYTKEQAHEFIARHDPRSVAWAIETTGMETAFIGMTGLADLDFRNRHCEWGIWIGPPSNWGKGYGTEACTLATRYAFDQLGMEKVYLSVYETNVRGRRAYEKAGYKIEGTLPRDHWWEGGFVTTYRMAAYRDDPLYRRD